MKRPKPVWPKDTEVPLRLNQIAEREEMIAALELADDVLRTVLKVYGQSPLVDLTREKIAAALGHEGGILEQKAQHDG